MKGKQNSFKEKAVAYLRVSSAKQEDGYSLDAQEKMTMQYAEKNNLDIVKKWKVQESAWGKQERKDFTAMIEYVKRNDSVKHIIFDVVDRMTRNDLDKLRITMLIKENGKIIHFARTNQMLNKDNLDSTKEFIMDVEVAASKKLSNDIAYKTRMGMTEKAEQGIYPSNAPLGYMNTHNKDKEAVVIVDPIAGPLITELFEYASTGKYSLEELEEIFYNKGLRTKFKGERVPYKSLSKTLHTPFYYGVFMWGKKLYKGTHKALVSKEVWDKTQEALLAKAHRFDTKHNYPFNRLIKCEHCGHYVLGSLAKNKYLYYRCAHYNKKHKSGYLKELELLDRLSGIVKDIELPQDVIKVLVKGLKKKGLKAAHIKANKKAVLENDLEKILKRKNNLLNMRLDGVINDEAYKYKQNELVQEQVRIESELSLCKCTEESIQKAVDGLEMLCGLEKCYKQADNYGKADLLRAVGDKYILTDNNQISVEYKEPFKAIYEAKLRNGCGDNSPLPNKKTALLNQGCLSINSATNIEFLPQNENKSVSKCPSFYPSTVLESCSKNHWGG